jgi:hypothetical protein
VRRTVVIDRRFRGPPNSANGGYTAGLVAEAMRGSGEVTLRRPPPLDAPLTLERLEHGRVELRDGDELIAEGVPQRVPIDAPAPVGLEEAAAGASASPWRERHPFPECFGCGPARTPGDGLRILPVPVPGRPDVYATPWSPHARFAAAGGVVEAPVVWAALDCASGAVLDVARGPWVLGRLAVTLRGPLEAGEPHVVMAWTGGGEGRKQETGSAVHTAGGELVGISRALWIELRPDQAAAATVGSAGGTAAASRA